MSNREGVQVNKDRLIEDLYFKNLSAMKISEQLDISKKEVYACIKSNDLKLKREEYRLKFIEDNYKEKSITEVSKLLNLSISRISAYLKKYKISKPKESIKSQAKVKRNATNLKKYGFMCPLKNEEVREKTKKTNLKKYGVENVSQSKEIRRKVVKTNMEKYGVSCALNSDIIKKKIKETNLEKYGVENPLSSKEIQEKIEETNLKRYKSKYPISKKETREKIKEKTGYLYPFQNQKVRAKAERSILDNYGVKNFSKSEEYRETRFAGGSLHKISGRTIADLSKETSLSTSLIRHLYLKENISEEALLDLILNYNQKITNIENKFSNELNIKLWNKRFDKNLYPDLKYKPDFKLSKNIAINIDGLYWHSEMKKEKLYHFKMRQDYELLGLRILQFREDEINSKMNIIKSMINNFNQNSERVFARKCQIQKVDQRSAEEFLNSNHIMGSIKAKHVGLYYNEELISIASFKKYKKVLKIERFCSKVNHIVIGGFGRFLKHLKLQFSTSIEKIDYWVDLRYGSGVFLKNFGFILARETLGWKWTDFNNTFNRLRCRANMDQRALTEKEQAEKFKWYKIYDAGQRLWELKL